MSLRIATLIALTLAFPVTVAWGNSARLSLFVSSKVRAVEGLARQKARKTHADREFGRLSRIYQLGAASLDEFEESRAASMLAEIDLRIAQLRADHARLSLEIAQRLESAGKALPICRRRKQSDESSAAVVLKRMHERKPINVKFDPPPSGTVVKIPDVEAPPIPQPDPKPLPQPEPQPIGGQPGGGVPGGGNGPDMPDMPDQPQPGGGGEKPKPPPKPTKPNPGP